MSKPDNARSPAQRRRPSAIRLIIFLSLIAAVIVIQYLHPEQYLDKERLRQIGAAHGILVPLLYLVVWTVGDRKSVV